MYNRCCIKLTLYIRKDTDDKLNGLLWGIRESKKRFELKFHQRGQNERIPAPQNNQNDHS